MRAALVLLLCILCCGCGLDWEQRAQTQYENGMTALAGRDLAQARGFFEEALLANPYHAGANFALAQCLEKRYQDESAALAYYERFLDLPEPSPVQASKAKTAIERLTAITQGEMQDPADACADLLASAKAGAKEAFLRSLHPAGIADAAAQGMHPGALCETWGDWRETEVVYREFIQQGDELWALLLLKTPQGSMQLVMRPDPTVEGGWLLGRYQPLTP